MDTPFKSEGAAETHTQLRSFSPIFPVRDLRRALAHYASLGFEVTPYADGERPGDAAGRAPERPRAGEGCCEARNRSDD